MMDFKSSFDKWTEKVNEALANYIIEKDTPEGNIYKATKYSLMAGGKRLRPVLAISVCEMLGGDINDILPYACAIEMIHTYSLIHDDLPAMDNDDYRRGMLTNHKVFGEAIAILAGDALLTYAFEIMLKHTLAKNDRLPDRIKIMEFIARSAGMDGMIGGQVVDLESERIKISAEKLEYMHRCKTGALIKAPIMASALLCGAGQKEYSCLETYAKNIGLAFQIKDDIMDVESSLQKMGKSIGKDAASGKTTFVSLFGIEEAKIKLNSTINQAIDVIGFFGEKALFLKELARYIENRNN